MIMILFNKINDRFILRLSDVSCLYFPSLTAILFDRRGIKRVGTKEVEETSNACKAIRV